MARYAVGRRNLLKTAISVPALAQKLPPADTTQATADSTSISDPAVDWDVEIDGTIDVSVASDTLVVSGGQDPVSAYDLTDGSQLWQAEEGHGWNLVSEGTIYVSDFRSDWTTADGTYAVDLETGSVEWQTDVAGKTGEVTENHVYVGGREGLYAIEKTTGDEAWRFRPPYEESQFFPRGFYQSDTYFIGDIIGRTYALSAEDGSLLWELDPGFQHWIFPQIYQNGALYLISYRGTVFKLDADTGEELWRTQTGDPRAAGNAVHSDIHLDNLLFVINHSPNKTIALDPETGDVVWEADGVASYVMTANDDTLFLGGDTLQALNKDNGQIQWQLPSPAEAVQHRDGSLYTADGGKQLRSLEADDGTEQWSLAIPDGLMPVSWVDASLDKQVIVYQIGGLNSDGHIYSITNEGAAATTDSGGTLAETPILTLVGGGVVSATVLLGGLGLLRLRRETNEEQTQTQDSIDAVLSAADEEKNDAQQAESTGEYSTAIEHYNTALEQYQTALDRTTDEAVSEETEAAINDLLEKRAALQELQEARSELTDILESAGQTFREAIIAHIRDERIVSRARYRQTRERYSSALELLDKTDGDVFATPIVVSIETGTAPPKRLNELGGLDDELSSQLAAAGIETIENLRSADFKAIRSLSAIDAKTTARLQALSWWPPTDGVRFTDRSDIARQRDRAQDGYDAVR